MALSEQDNHDFLVRIYDQYSKYVYKLAWQYATYDIEVADLVQEVWIKVCAKAGKMRTLPTEQQLSYISAVVRNTAISLSRKAEGLLPLDVTDSISYNEADILNNILDRQLSAQRFSQLWPLVPQFARELLERKYLMDESDDEIAQALGIGRSSVRMYLTRARRTAFAVLSAYKDQLI